MNIVFPFFAIITAGYLFHLQHLKTLRIITIIQTVIILLLIVISVILHVFYQPGNNFLFFLLLAMSLGFLFYFLRRANLKQVNYKILYLTVVISLYVNLYMNLVFYPSLLHYQSGSEVARWLNKNNSAQLPVAQLREEYNYAFEFYLKQPLNTIDSSGYGIPQRPFLLFASSKGIEGLLRKGWKIDQPVIIADHYAVSRLTPKFINKSTRENEIIETRVVVVR
jgi:hypothetical protein